MPERSIPLLAVKGLRTWFHTDQGVAKAVDDVSFEVYPGKTLAIVGESGCGKSVTAMSILGLVPTPPGAYEGGEILFEGKNLLEASAKEIQSIRGNDISMIFQEPMTSMNPVFRVGHQIGATLRLHRGFSKAEARAETIRLLDRVGIPAPEQRVDDYPHQMSGGMLQRIMIAMALACNPKVLIADEPTTALDVTIQAQILALLRTLQESSDMAIILITHDLGVVAEVADEVLVMYAGQVVEQAPVHTLFAHPAHPYTRALFKSLPGTAKAGERLHSIQGNVPAATQFPQGCRFAPRCPHAQPHCGEELPATTTLSNNHHVACWLHDEAHMAALGLPPGFPAKELSL